MWIEPFGQDLGLLLFLFALAMGLPSWISFLKDTELDFDGTEVGRGKWQWGVSPLGSQSITGLGPSSKVAERIGPF